MRALSRTSSFALSASLILSAASLLLAPLDSEARKRVHVYTSTSSNSSSAPPAAQQPSQAQLEQQAAARERAQKAAEENKEKRLAEYRERQAADMAQIKERQEARLAAQRVKMEASRSGVDPAGNTADTSKVAKAAAPASKPTVITSYKDANGRMHFTDGTDSPSQPRMR
jgi:hypothetical protein